jgi:hypothetical protein
MPRVLTRGPFLALAAGAALCLASCLERGERLPESGATLEGTVKYGTEAVPYALVIVVGDKTSSSGKIGEDGRYKVENCPVGEVKVAVNTDAGKGDYMTAVMSGGSYQGPTAKTAKKATLKFVEVPKQYHDPETTPLKRTVSKGPNTYDIAIPK